MVSRSLVLGFHGCDEQTAIKILNGADQVPSQNEYDWLGAGLYFWEDSKSRALRWAADEARKPNSKIKKPAVLGAVINLGACLNLIDAEHLELVTLAHRTYLEFCGTGGFAPAQNRGKDLRARYLDKVVFETLHSLRAKKGEPPFDTVRAFFVEGEPLYENAGLRTLDHVQICVRNPQSIVGYFLPRN